MGWLLTWEEPGFMLQSASAPDGPWLDVSDISPLLTAASDAHRYFRLRK